MGMGIPAWDAAIETARRVDVERIRQARMVKAAKLAVVMQEAGADADTVRALPAEARRIAERVAKVRESSDATWEMVARNIEHAAKIQEEVDALFERLAG